MPSTAYGRYQFGAGSSVNDHGLLYMLCNCACEDENNERIRQYTRSKGMVRQDLDAQEA